MVTTYGLVTRSTGSWYDVLLEDNSVFKCRVVGKFKLNGWKLSNPVAVGDRVEVTKEDQKEKIGTIIKILPRDNYVVRQSPRQKHHLHLLAANVDQAVLIITMTKPNLKLGFIDRFLLMTEPYHIPVIIVFNKSDLYEEKHMDKYNDLRKIYTSIGYEVLLTTAIDIQTLEPFKKALSGKISLISGQSGVGKSTLINAIEPGLNISTAEISQKTEKGQHTTTFASMYTLKEGGKLIDTPGIKNLTFNNLEVMDVAHNFREFFMYSSHCKYGDCTHRKEPQCSVRKAIETGDIAVYRYNTYLQILDEIEQQNYWEIHSM